VSYLLEHPWKVLALAGDHAALVGAALLAALAIALPLGIYAARRPHLAALLLGALGVIYTIPSLALLAVLVRWLGIGFGSIFVALIAYAQFMLARNIVAGINGVDPAQVDAAHGLGMSNAQVLLRVELPQALPVMLGGVRVAAIAMIAIATLAGYVGGGGLGVLIFTGLALHNNAEIVAGSIAASLLAIAVDASLRVVERVARR
jgi:osmoprotectant transport system permease protein